MDARFDGVLAKLDRVKRSGNGWSARCPAHDDGRASLRVWVADGGDLRLKCFAGCGFAEIIAAMGIDKDECNAERSRRVSKEVAHYDYRDEDGNLLFQVVRFEPKDFRQRVPNGNGWTWGMNGVRRVLYRLPELVKEPTRNVLLVEGEKDVDRLMKEKFLATCNPMGAGKWEPGYTESLKGRSVIVIPDADKSGEDHSQNVIRQLTPVANVCMVRLDKKDVSEWFNAGHTAAELKELCKAALKTSEAVRLVKSLDIRGKVTLIRQVMDDLDAAAFVTANVKPEKKPE